MTGAKAAGEGSPVLEVQGISARYGHIEALKSADLSVSRGELVAVLGPNGAGKSTLLRVIAGLLRAAEGGIELAGGIEDASLPEQAHYLGHLDAAKPSLTVRENLTFWANFLGAPDETAVDVALDSVELGSLADLPAAYLSAGQKRRLSIARLLAVKRPVWLLDEPTSALDAQSQDRLATFMRDHLTGGGMIIAATHGPVGLDAPRELKMGAAG